MCVDTLLPGQVHRKKRYQPHELPEQIVRTSIPPANQKGGERDLMGMYARIYTKNGWDQYAKLNTQGSINTPYVLFKAKNVTDISTQAQVNESPPDSPGHAASNV